MYLCILLLGKEYNAAPEKGLAHNIVMLLFTDLKNKGYHVYVDNYYTSALFLDLMNDHFEACGTVRNDRRGLSEKFKTVNLSKGKRYKIKTNLCFTLLLQKERHIVKGEELLFLTLISYLKTSSSDSL